MIERTGTPEPFQVMPPLTDDEYEALKADIAASGVRVPVDVDQHGRILDGHHRSRACKELGIEPPTRVIEVSDDHAAREHAYATNTTRRHLDREQKRELVARSLLTDPGLSDRQHAARCGVSPTTAGAVRRELVAAGRLSNLDTRIGADGRARRAPVAYRWPYPDGNTLAAAMAVHGIVTVLPFLARIPSPGMERDRWELFCHSIAERGIRSPVTVTPAGVLLDGRSRLMAALVIGTDRVPVEVADLDHDAALSRCMSLNFQRQSIGYPQLAALTAAQFAWRYTVREWGRGLDQSAAEALYPIVLQLAAAAGDHRMMYGPGNPESLRKLLTVTAGELLESTGLPAGPVFDFIDGMIGGRGVPAGDPRHQSPDMAEAVRP